MVMRFQKGSIVEVLSKSEMPPGSWHCAEVICGNDGGDYTVRYAGMGNVKFVEKVSRKAIRPRPPLSEISENWVPGDVVEVFDDYSWKMATVSKTLRKKQFLVRLIGSSLEFKASITDIRVRQSWEDRKWVVIGKGSANYDDRKHGESLLCHQNLTSQCHKTNTRMIPQDCFPVENQKSHLGSFRNLKRGSPYENCQAEGRARATKKNRTGYFAMDIERRNSNDADNVTCSVGSCSIVNNDSYWLPRVDPSDSDAESCCRWENEEGKLAEVHELELNAYRRTIGALHAAGPLSWEQEALMTNLRLFLNISNDEHLMEIRSLISAGNSNSYRL